MPAGAGVSSEGSTGLEDLLLNTTLCWPLHSKEQLASLRVENMRQRGRPGCPCNLVFYRTLLVTQVNLSAFTRLNTRWGLLGASFLAQGCILGWVCPPGLHGAERSQAQLQDPLGSASSSGKGSRPWSQGMPVRARGEEEAAGA